MGIQPWWLSGLIHHVSNSSRDRWLGPEAILRINLDTSPKSEPALEPHSRAVPSVEAHHHVNCPNTGRNSGGRGIKKVKL